MKKCLLVLIVVVFSGSVFSQSLSTEQEEVWSVITKNWELYKTKDWDAMYRDYHPNILVWGSDIPMPRNKGTLREWDRYVGETSTDKIVDLAPTGIVVQGSTAVAHYYFTVGREEEDGEREITPGRCTDVLIREGGHWLFIAWHCSEEPGEDD